MIFKYKKSNQAFTLLEILLSIFLFAIIALGIAATTQETTKLSQRLKIRSGPVLNAQVTLDRVQRDLEMAYNETLQGSPSIFKSATGMNGPSLTFSFIESPMKTLIERRTPGLKLLHYRVEKDEGSTFKLIRVEDYLTADNRERIAEKAGQILASGIVKWDLRFYDSKTDTWRSDWNSAGTATLGFPSAVRVHLEAVNADLPSNERDAKKLVYETDIMLLNSLENP